jgi:error-prone DNA polymerase
MPMGFYQPAQIIYDARKHGVKVRPVDINHSSWDNTLEEKHDQHCYLRLGFRQVKGLKEEDMEVLIKARGERYASVQQLRETGLPDRVLERLADADAFRSIGLDRRQALWEVSVKDRPTAVFKGKEPAEEKVSLPTMLLSEHVLQDYAATSLSLKAHPVSFVREQLDQLRVRTTASLQEARDGDPVKVAGLILVRQRPGTASGICFITIEDETGAANLVVFQNLFDRDRKEIIQARLLMVDGHVQREGAVIHVVVRKCHNITRLMRKLTPIEEPVFPEARNFK